MAEHPLRERLWALLLRSLEAAGRRAEALDSYAQARQVISDELGVDPSSELQRLYADLLAADATSAPSPPARRRARHAPAGGPPRPSTAPTPCRCRRGCRGRRGCPDGIQHGRRSERGGRRPDAPTSGQPSSGELGGAIAVGTFADPSAAAAAQQADAAVAVPLAARPSQLPADIADFTGRETHVDHLCGLLLTATRRAAPARSASWS